MRQCIIGKNSRIVSQLRLDKNFGLFSSAEIDVIPFADYDRIWLFSWFYNDFKKNIEIIKSIPGKKLVFISTQSVASNWIAKQPYRYVKDKLECEKLVLSRNGKVFRIASVDSEKAMEFGEIVAYTSVKKLEDFINNSSSQNLNSVTEFYDLTVGSIKPGHSITHNFLNKLRAYRPLNLVHAVFCKLFGISCYGYSRDAQRVLSDVAVIGHGAIGGYATQNLVTSKDATFVSDEVDYVLDKNGFRKQIIGLSKFGLGGRWHGVSTCAGPNGTVIKNVDINVFRSSRIKPFNLHKRRIKAISYDGGKYLLTVQTKEGTEVNFCSKRLILGAGWAENIRLLSSLAHARIDTCLTDDESAVIGTISVTDAIKTGLVTQYGPIILFKNGIMFNSGSCFVEARLPLRCYNDYYEYYASVYKILWNLMRSFNFQKLNSAFFNKFGVALMPGSTLDLFLTEVVEGAISCVCENGDEVKYSRTRKLESPSYSLETIIDKFPSFKRKENISSFDGLHVTGGSEILALTPIQKLIEEKKLLILGTPGPHKDDPFHTTKRLQLSAKEQVEDFYK